MVATTKPKGATTYKETAFGILPRSKLLKLEIEGTKRGLEYLITRFQQKEVPKLTLDLILNVHDEAYGWIFPLWAGKFRTVQVTYSGKEAPHYSQIAIMLTNLCNDTEEQVSNLSNETEETRIGAIVRILAQFQHRFVFIHPFQDYNGRTARMITNYLLLRMKLPMTEIIADTQLDRKNYLSALKQADTGNYSLLEQLISNSIREKLEVAQY